MEETAVLVTGSTGFVGSNLIVELIRSSRDLLIICPARSSRGTHARTRVLESIQAAKSADSKGALPVGWEKRLHVLEASLDNIALAVSAAGGNGDGMPRVTSIWHCASNTAYENTPEVDLQQINVEGTRNVLTAARQLRCPEVNYVSTAYVAGCRGGRIKEQLPCGDEIFNNTYEETKAEAERLLVASCGQHELSFRIFRPSIIVGNSRTFRSNSEGGFNKVIDSSFKLKKAVLERNPTYILNKKRFSVSLDPEKYINLIPIDHVIEEMLNIRAAENASLNKIYHITSNEQLSVADAMLAFSRVFGIEVECGGSIAQMDRAERAFDRAISQFKPYLNSNKTFQRQTEASLNLVQSHANWRPGTEFVHALMQARSAEFSA